MTEVKPSELPGDLVEAAGYPPGQGWMKPGYDPRLTNEDLAPLEKQTWKSYNIFAFWMSDVHSVGGYVTMGTLFSIGLTAWQVFICLIAGICIVQFFCNLVAKPSQQAGVPYPVTCRASFGVLGANIPAIIRGCIAIAWYGVQTYLAAESLNIVFIKLFPGMATWDTHMFLGLSALGYISYAILWVLQALLFMRGMEMIRKFIDYAGPAVYVVMVVMCLYMLTKVHWDINLNLSPKTLSGGTLLAAMLAAIASVVSYFSGPMLNFGDFSRYAKDFGSIKKGNFLGLPINFIMFSLLTVLTAAATVPLYGELITDPIKTVQKIDSTFAIVLGGFTFVVATIGINIVANFVSPAFDFSNVAPRRISWRTGGMIAAVASIFITPWNLFNNPAVIHYTLDVLGAFIGPLYGVLVVDFYLVKRGRLAVDDLYTVSPSGAYWYRDGVNWRAVAALLPAALIAVLCVMVPTLTGAANFSWFIGAALGALFYRALTLGVSARASRIDA